MKGSKRKWKLLCAGLVAAGVLVAGVPGEQAPVAEAMYSSVDASHHWYKTPSQQQKLFMLAIRDGDYATVKDLIDAGVDVNGVYESSVGWPSNNPGATPLYIAIDNNQRDIMQLLLENGADVNGFYTFKGGYLPYMVLVSYIGAKCLDTLQYLHNWGADVNLRCTLQYWMQGSAVDYLIRRINYNQNDNALFAALNYLLDQGANPDGAEKNADNAFMKAVHYRNYRMIDLLAARGANVSARDRDGKNAMEYALSINDLPLYKHVKALMDRGTQPSNYTPPAGTAISIDNPKGNKTGSAAQSHAGRGTTASKYADVFAKYSEASEKIYNELSKELTRDMTKPDQKKAALSKEADAIKELKKLNEKMAKEDPLKGLKGYSVGEREKFTDAFDGIREKNEAMIAYMEYCVAHPDDAQEDQLTALTQAVLTAHETQKQRVDAVLALIKN